MNHFTEEELMPEKPMSEVTPLNEFSVEMLEILDRVLFVSDLNFALSKFKGGPRHKCVEKWLSITRTALKDAKENETKLPY